MSFPESGGGKAMPLLKVGAEPASEATPLEHWAQSPLGFVRNMVLYPFYVFSSV